MKAVKAWVSRHPTATMRCVTLPAAAVCLVIATDDAIRATGSPEACVILGAVALVLMIVASADIGPALGGTDV